MSLPFPIPSVVVWGILIIQAIALIALYRRWRSSQSNHSLTVKVKPTGHSAFVEGLIPVAIGIGFFALATIAAYSFAYDQAQALLLGKGTTGDIILVVIAGFLGLLNGIATSVAAVRWRIHTIRKDPEESFYHAAALRMFWLCFGVESLTLNYFLYRLTPESYPTWMGAVIDFVHASMSISRGVLIPLDLAFLAAFLADLIITLSDRKRAIRVFTGQRMTLFEQRLTDDQHPIPADQAEELLNTYAGMQALNEFASDASDDEKKANAELFAKLCGAKGVVTKATMDGFVQQDHLQAVLTQFEQRITDVQTHATGVSQDFAEWATQLKHDVMREVTAVLADLEGRWEQGTRDNDRFVSPRASSETIDRGMSRVPGDVTAYQANSTQGKSPSVAVLPRPGTRRFRDLVYETGLSLVSSDQVSIYHIAQKIGARTDDVQSAIEVLKRDRIRMLKPGDELQADPVLDRLA